MGSLLDLCQDFNTKLTMILVLNCVFRNEVIYKDVEIHPCKDRLKFIF